MKQLSDSFKMGPVTVKNRIAVPPMVCFDWADDTGHVTDRHLAHYRALAKGGAGVIFSEAVCVTKRGRLHQTQLGLWEDGQIEGWKKLSDACHQHGTNSHYGKRVCRRICHLWNIDTKRGYQQQDYREVK